jgi:YVTN family beta-propeller protein
MSLKKPISLLLCLSLYASIFGQNIVYTSANVHSHNDYEQSTPFYQAYHEEFGSIEADIHLTEGLLLVGHDSKHLTKTRSLETLYLTPLTKFIKQNGGFPYKDKTKKLQLLIDVKSDSVLTLNALVILLKKFPAIIQNPNIRIVISGNRPEENTYTTYPPFIWFDGRLNKEYNKTTLSKIGLLSNDLKDFSKWNGKSELPEKDRQTIKNLVEKAHAQKKPIRFWATPDFPSAWKEIMSLQIDYLNTDHIEAISDFLRRQNDSLRLMPYNRVIKSAGTVIRFGRPETENHALDAAILSKDGKVIIEDRYGIAALDITEKKIISRWSFADMNRYAGYMSTYSGIQSFTENGKVFVVWSAAGKGSKSSIMIAEWANNSLSNISDIAIDKLNPALNALPNDIEISREQGDLFLYVVLNGNNELLKIRWSDRSIVWRAATGVAPYGVAIANKKIYVSNWAGPTAKDSTKERAGVPWGLAYTDPRTGATSTGTLTVLDLITGKNIREINVGLHPNAVAATDNGKYIYVANGSSDIISVINTNSDVITESIKVGLLNEKLELQGSTPNALELNAENNILYVANGFDNAIAVVRLGKNASVKGIGNSIVTGYIPTEAYPGGIKLIQNNLVVANLESDGANVIDEKKNARSIHNQLASVSIIPVPDKTTLDKYTVAVTQLNLLSRTAHLNLQPRAGIAPVPVPERIGEPSVFKHVVYIIKENKTYDQVFGDLKWGRGDSSLCIFGEKVTPNMHALAKKYGWMDDFNASGKCSAEGHQWTDAGMVNDYIEKSVRAWFRSYPHRQADALVYNKAGFIWNQAVDHGKTVRIYGEACETEYDKKLKWTDLYKNYKDGKKPDWKNKTTIARIRPLISPTFPDCDNIAFSDQQRADIFIEEWKAYEQAGNMPNLMVMSLPNDHSAGTSPGFPTPNAMVADNDLAVGRIVEMISNSKYWDSTVIFITEDDSQSGWDHISAYRTTGLVISPYSTGRLVTSNYNQTSMLKTIEQILGLPPMNIMDATARLMTDCFQKTKNSKTFTALANNIPLDQMNKPLNALKGQAKKYALQSQLEVFNEVDGGEDDKMNRIIWFYAKGEASYPESK